MDSIDWTQIIVAGAAILGIVISGILNSSANRKVFASQRKEAKINEITDSLNNFYYPLLLLCNKNKQLYDMFKNGKSDSFRTLVSLLEGEKFDGNDRKVLDQILSIDGELNELILKNKGLVQDVKLNELLSKASVHFTIIDLANKGSIKGEMERFSPYVYPRGLQDEIQKKVDQLVKIIANMEK